MGVDTELNEPELLKKEDFLKKFPGITNVASFIGSIRRPNPSYDRLGINNINEYLELMNQGNEQAIEIYRDTKNILHF